MNLILIILAHLLILGTSGCYNFNSEKNTPKSEKNNELLTKIKVLEKRIIELEKAQNGNRSSERRKCFVSRRAKDKKMFNQKELVEIEKLYQSANGQQEKARKEILQKIIDKYPKANRAGCAMQYLAQIANWDEREKCFRKAMDEFGDCWYGDGVQVGSYARFYLAFHCLNTGKAEEAEKLFKELRVKYPDSIDHRGRLLLYRLPSTEKINEIKK